MKGGVGKTTLCVNLGFELFTSKNRVLIVDNDPQFSATSALMKPDDYINSCIKTEKHLTIYNIYEKPPRLAGTKRKSLDPSKFFVTTWFYRSPENLVLDLIPSRIELFETLRNPSQKEYLLDTFLKNHAQNYDYILIDCPPTPSVLTASAFAASDYVLIPVTPDYFSTIGLPQFLGTLMDFKDNVLDPHDVTPLGVIFTNVERTPSTSTLQSMERVRTALQDFPMELPVFESKMSHFKVYENTLWQSVPVQQITGPGIRGKSLAVADLRHIERELCAKIAKKVNKKNDI